MLPIILVSADDQAVDRYVESYQKQQKIPAYYVFKLQPEKTEFTIGQVREIIKETVLTAGARRIFVLYAFDMANIEAQNAFLKTLEERHEHNQFFLVVTNKHALLPTIRSRCNIVHLQSRPTSLVGTDIFQALKETTNYAVLGHPEVLSMNREKAISFFDACIISLQKELKDGALLPARLLKQAIQTKALLINNNLNPQLAVDGFLLAAKKQLQKNL